MDVSPLFAEVLLPRPFSDTYTYALPKASAERFEVGQAVQVPFGKQSLWGVIWSLTEKKPAFALKEVMQTAPYALSDGMRAFIARVARYTLTPVGSVLKMVIPVPDAFEKPARKEATPEKLLPKEVTLSEGQKKALEEIKRAIAPDTFSPVLFQGATGAGKTEVYFKLIEAALDRGEQALVLVPEIALTPQWTDRFTARFGFKPHVWHSDLTPKQRRETWQAVAEGRARVVLGARSALFLPYPRLGLIVVDEEHEESYKQEDGAIYQARDMAVLRAATCNLTVLLTSATPSLESLWNVEQGRYAYVKLESRYQAEKPALYFLKPPPAKVDAGCIAPELRCKLRETLEAGQQSLLFLNRRGYAPFVRCGGCSAVAQCPNCDLGLVFHKRRGDLRCHACSYEQAASTCRLCGAHDMLSFTGPGVEKIQEEVATFLPDARIAVMSSDHTNSPKKLSQLITALEEREVDVLIGTQMVAKGHHFPQLTCVGILEGDAGLHHMDFRSHERLYQLLSQVSGRAGRSKQAGNVYIQTQEPNHPLFEMLVQGQEKKWLEEALQLRQAHSWPPWGRLAAIIISGCNSLEVQTYAQRLVAHAPQVAGVTVLGPIPAPLSYLRGRYRWRILVKSPRAVPLQNFLEGWTKEEKPTRALKMSIDMDPYSFM